MPEVVRVAVRLVPGSNLPKLLRALARNSSAAKVLTARSFACRTALVFTMFVRRRVEAALPAIIITSLFWLSVLLFFNVYLTDWCTRNQELCDCGYSSNFNISSRPIERESKAYMLQHRSALLVNRRPGAERIAAASSKLGLDSLARKPVAVITTTNDPSLPGEMGQAFRYGSDVEQQEAKALFKVHQFNIYASDRISLQRSLPDYRMQQCRSKTYPPPSTMPTVSIIIVFHNEAWSTLLRSLYSIVNRTPLVALNEIILVDDYSEDKFTHLKTQLELELKNFPVSIRLLRMPERSGLIRARLKGAAESTGQVLLFLDAHIECTQGWFEPLVARLMDNPKRAVSPIIDVIDDNSFEYVTASDLTYGGFNWKLNFRWFNAPPEREAVRRHSDMTTPLRTPVMAGGLFAIFKDYFYAVGAYDEG